MKASRFGTAISLLAVSATLAACAAPRVQTSGLGGPTGDDTGLATRAAIALANKDVPNAIQLAERAVARTPDDAGFRGLLGNAYFAGGRFRSAEAAYKDALSLYSNQPQVVLKLVLADIAQGKNAEALSFLEAGREVLPVSDYGLALALAGRPADAVSVLRAAAQGEDADSRIRQNLALAYALSGDWNEARTVASQDVPANQIDARIQQWMQLAKPANGTSQVAALVGVTPAAVDAGQPIRLALVSKSDVKLAKAAPAAPAHVAASTPAPAPVRAPAPAPTLAAIAPAPVVAAVAQAAPPPPPPFPQFAEAVPPAPPPPRAKAAKVVKAEAPSPAPVTAALMTAAANVRSAFDQFIAPKPKAVAKVHKAPVKVQQAAYHRGNSPAVLQLGAYGSPERVMAAWNSTVARHGALKAYMPVSARFVSPRGTVYRLSVKGFASADQAKDLCIALRRAGGSCFVRNSAGDAPVQYAMR